MLVFISDLHFVDETSGKHNTPARAYEGFVEDLANNTNAGNIKIIFLGDVFDLLRTTTWFRYPVDERPWGTDSDAIEEHANEIMDMILEKNEQCFELFGGKLKDKFGCEPERVYIPGNHDRLCNIYPSLREKVINALGLNHDKDDAFDNIFEDPEHSVYAAHGHEFDPWNFEGDGTSPEDYRMVPIGDVITTEIVSKLAYKLYLKITLPEDEKAALIRNFQEVENVRPFSALFKWLFYQVRLNNKIKDEIKDALNEIAEEFDDIRYVQEWYSKHDKFGIRLDIADKLQDALRLFRLFDLDSVEWAMHLYSRITGSSAEGVGLDDSDKRLIKSARDVLERGGQYDFCLFGHTHNPMQVPVSSSGGRSRVYLNTGTWRNRHLQDLTGGFMAVKNLTYSIIYNKDENESQLFETWNGSLKEK